MSWADWTPTSGAIVHLRADNPWKLAAGRYRLERVGETWKIDPIKPGAHRRGIRADELERAAWDTLTPIDAAELERDRQAIDLAAMAPLRCNRRRPLNQSGAAGLPLFGNKELDL